MKELRDVIASNIVSLRTEKKLTQCKLAEVLNYSDKAVSKWERGESVPDITVLKQIADYFEVSVDYLLSESHEDYERKKEKYSVVENKNHLIITALAAMLVWLIATFAFVQMNIIMPDSALPSWLMFIYAIPASAIVLLIFNSIWGCRGLNFLIISIILWSVILSVYFSFLFAVQLNFWLLFILGVPGQLIIVLWSGLKKIKRVK